MSTLKQRIARRVKNAELARVDAENRCANCKRNLAEVSQIVEDFLVPGKCCSDDCLSALIDQANAAEYPEK